MRITFAIMGICLAVLLLQVTTDWASVLLALTPTLAVQGMYWQFITYMFTHGSIHHFGVNMFGLFIFGTVIEKVLGAKQYILMYITAGIASAILHILLSGVSAIPLVGASGSVFAVLTAYALEFPESRLFIFPLPIPVKAKYVVAGFIAFSILAGFTGIMPGIAHFGHLGGIIMGIAFMYVRKRQKKKEDLPDGIQWIWEAH